MHAIKIQPKRRSVVPNFLWELIINNLLSFHTWKKLQMHFTAQFRFPYRHTLIDSGIDVHFTVLCSTLVSSLPPNQYTALQMCASCKQFITLKKTTILRYSSRTELLVSWGGTSSGCKSNQDNCFIFGCFTNSRP
jgi:hypothetical protein